MPDFYAAYADEKFVTNLLHGWGYNFYRAENQLRADDLMVRARVGEMLCAARASIEAAESAYRRTHLPPPSREHPRQNPETIRQAQSLEDLAHRIGALEGQIRALPVPETDRMTQRLRDERETLQSLLFADHALIASAARLRALAAENAAGIDDVLDTLARAIVARRDLLGVERT